MFAFIEQLKNAERIENHSPLYPKDLLSLSDAPQALYAIGNTALVKERKITVVGSRRTPTSALKIGEQIAKELSSSFVIITGTADGGDGAAIEGALSGSGRVICLLAGGFSTIPQGNLPLLKKVAEKGLLLSPHTYDTPVRVFSYEYRNKLLAAMGEGTLVLGAAEKSGALITAKYAGQMKKTIFALPYAPGAAAGAGCNALIKKGAYLTETATDVLEKFGIEKAENKPIVALTGDEEKMYAALQDMAQGHISELAAKAGVPPYKARAVLSALEVKGLAISLGGNTFSPLG